MRNLQPKRPRAAGLSMPELLVSLSISAILLLATAAAVNASFSAYQINQERSSIIQRQRVIMNRLLTYIRSSDNLIHPETAAVDTSFSAGTTVSDIGLAWVDANGNKTSVFHWDSASQTLRHYSNGAWYPMLDGVTSFQITYKPMQSPTALQVTPGVYDWLQEATVLMTVKTAADDAKTSETTNTQVITASGSASPRFNAW